MNCSDVERVVHISQYEHKDRRLKEKWEKIFKEYEIPSKKIERRASVIREYFSQQTFERVGPIINLELAYPLRDKRLSIETIIEGEPLLESKETLISEESTIAEEEQQELQSDLESDLEVNLPSSRDEAVDRAQPNPYLKFLKRPEQKAATWRPKDVYVIPTGASIEGAAELLKDPKRSLAEKAHTVTSHIIKDFCDWFEGLGGVHHELMTEGVLHQLFEIGFNAPAARSLCVNIRELPVITEQLAKARNRPEASVREGLHRLIAADIKAEKRKPRYVGFGTTLKPPLRYNPPNNETQKKWVDLPAVPDDLATHRAVWEGITALRSTRSFCKYLNQHPDISPPEYLRRIGMVKTK